MLRMRSEGTCRRFDQVRHQNAKVVLGGAVTGW